MLVQIPPLEKRVSHFMWLAALLYYDKAQHVSASARELAGWLSRCCAWHTALWIVLWTYTTRYTTVCSIATPRLCIPLGHSGGVLWLYRGRILPKNMQALNEHNFLMCTFSFTYRSLLSSRVLYCSRQWLWHWCLLVFALPLQWRLGWVCTWQVISALHICIFQRRMQKVREYEQVLHMACMLNEWAGPWPCDGYFYWDKDIIKYILS